MSLAIRPGAIAVITGVAKGIGFSLAKRFLREGMNVVGLDSDAGCLDQSRMALEHYLDKGQKLTFITGNATNTDAQHALFQEAMVLGQIGVLVNNAAVGRGAGPWENVGQWRDTMEVNFWSALELQQLFVPAMLEQSGCSAVVNLGSKEGITTPPGNAAYSVSKAAIRILTEQLAHELRQRVGAKVSAHLVIPGYTSTPPNFPDGLGDGKKATVAWTADQAVDFFVKRMSNNDFYIFCGYNEVTRTLDERRLQWSADDMILNRPALSRWHTDFAEAYQDFIAGAQNHPDNSPFAYNK